MVTVWCEWSYGNDGGTNSPDAGGGLGCQWLKSELFGVALMAFKVKWGINSASSHDTLIM